MRIILIITCHFIAFLARPQTVLPRIFNDTSVYFIDPNVKGAGFDYLEAEMALAGQLLREAADDTLRTGNGTMIRSTGGRANGADRC